MSYNDVDYILKLPVQTGINLIYRAIEKERDRKLWEMWLMRYQYMDKENFVSFSEFKKQQNPEISKRSKDEILKDVYEIREKLRR